MNEILEVRHGVPAAHLAHQIIREEEESARLLALESYEILDSAPEKSYDDIARLAAYVCAAPIALITFYDHDQQWVKSRFATGNFADRPLQLPSGSLLCERMVQQPGKVTQISDRSLADGF